MALRASRAEKDDFFLLVRDRTNECGVGMEADEQPIKCGTPG